MRIFAISNIHGHYDAFKSLLKEVDFNPESDKLIILGDMIDYGPKSFDTIELCIELRNMGAMVLKGDHEQRYLSAFNSLDEEIRNSNEEKIYKVKNQMLDFYLDFPDIRDKHLDFFKSLNTVYHFENFVFSHAGIDVGNELNGYNYTLYAKDFFQRTDLEDSSKTYVFGHVPVVNMKGHLKSEPFVRPNMIGIDLGSRITNGYLGLIQLTPERKVYKVQVKENYKV